MKSDGLVLQFIPYVEIESLDSEARVDKLLSLVKDNKIVLIEGKIKPTEEAMLIRRTMEEIDRKFLDQLTWIGRNSHCGGVGDPVERQPAKSREEEIGELAAQRQRCGADPELIEIGCLIVRRPTGHPRRIQQVHLQVCRARSQIVEGPVVCSR